MSHTQPDMRVVEFHLPSKFVHYTDMPKRLKDRLFNFFGMSVCLPGSQFNCTIEYSIDFSIEFCSTVGHPVKLNRKVNRIFNKAIELTPWLLKFNHTLFLSQENSLLRRVSTPPGPETKS